jgi:RNA polymerase sigma-70 factor (ECF subfamily)
MPVIRRRVRQRRAFLQTQDVEDLVQDVLVSIHAVRATYDPDRPFLPWLMAIARNRLADGARRHARVSANEITVENLPETFSGATTNRHPETYGDPQALRRAIDQLPAGQRKAIELLKLREASLREAAALTGMSINALKIAVHRGMKTLRLALTSEM